MLTVKELKNALIVAGAVVGRSGPRPVLQNIAIGPRGIRATNLDEHIELELETGLTSEILVSKAALGKLIGTFKDGKAEVLLRNRLEGGLDVNCQGIRSVVPSAHSIDEFPVFPASVPAEFVVDRTLLIDVLERVAVAASSDETRYQMFGVFLEVRGSRMTASATDGKRLATEVVELLTPGPDQDAILRLPAVETLLKLLKKDRKGPAVGISFPDNGKLIQFDGILTSRLVEGSYPEYRRALPESFEHVFNLPVEPLLAAVRSVKTATTKETQSIKLEFRDGFLTLTATSAANGDSAASVEFQGTGEFAGYWNPNYLIDVLEAVGKGRIDFSVRDRKTVGVFSVGSYRHVIMPLIIEEPVPAETGGNE